MIKITNHDLTLKQYDMATLEANINNLSVTKILYHQKLTAQFCIKFILDDEYAKSVEDSFLDIYDVVNLQPHITLQELLDEIDNMSE